MAFEILKREALEFSNSDIDQARQYLGLCGDEPIDMFLHAAVELIEAKSQVAMRKIEVLFTTPGGSVYAPIGPVDKVKSIKVVSSHGVHMGYHSTDIHCLPNLCDQKAHYEINYTARAGEVTHLTKIGVFAAAKAIYDGEEVPDLSAYIKMPNAIERFAQAVGGINVKVL